MQILTLIGFILFWLVIAVAVIHVLLDNRQPAKTFAWVLVILFIPVVGVVFYLFFGINHRKERLISQRSLDQLTKRSMLEFVEQLDLHVPEEYKQLVDLFVNQNLSLPFKMGDTDIITDGYAFFPALLKDIAQAHHHIHLDMYIIEDDPLGRLLADALMDKARKGVEVRIIYDDVGCWRISRRFFEQLRGSGVELAPFLPVRFPSFTSKVNYRNHRKLIVIDGQVGYIGGMNIALRYVKNGWRDTMLRMTGSIVYGLQRTFLVDWYFVDRTLVTSRDYYPATTSLTTPLTSGVAQVVTSGPMDRYPDIMQGFVCAILAARHYIYIETPYFLPNETVLFALKTAAVGGVDVRILCPLRSDARFTDWASRSYMRELHEAGAKVSLYEKGFLHSKIVVIDDKLATCGSTNVDFRSFENNFEANVFIYDEDVALRMKEIFMQDAALSVDLGRVPGRLHPRFFQKLWESLTRLLAPLL
jgi:cardiolipin synthase